MSHTDYDDFEVVRIRRTPLSEDVLGVRCIWCAEVVYEPLEHGTSLEDACLAAAEHMCDVDEDDA